MLYKSLFRRTLSLHLAGNSIRTFASATMASSPQSLSLDRSIFNEALYSRVRGFWFDGLSDTATTPPFDLLKKWYGVNTTEEQKKAFDNECRERFADAIRALGPERLALPAFEGYDKDIRDAEGISSPLLAEVEDAQAQDPKKGSETLVSLILLLDQITRNIHRDPAGLKLVFSHYDRLAFALLHGSLKFSPNPVEHESVRLRPVVKSWYLMPLMHSEHLASHELFSQLTDKMMKDVESVNDKDAVENVQKSVEFEKKHVEPLRLFGRYPHRNEALGRKTTKEEQEYLKSAETFGVQQQQKSDDKDEL